MLYKPSLFLPRARLKILLAAFLSAMLPMFLIACGAAPAAQAPKEIRLPDGKVVEERVSLDYAGRTLRIFHEYRDSSGNFLRHGSDRHFYRSGQVKFEEQYKAGKLDGLSEFWYDNGAKEGELPYRDGKPDGHAMTWYPDGKKKSEKCWKAGRLDGVSREWNEKGEETAATYWRDNAKIPAPPAAPSTPSAPVTP